LREQKYIIENHVIEPKKSLFGKIEATERTGVFIQGLNKEQVQNIFSRYIFNKSIEDTYNSMKSWVQEQKDKIDKYYKDLNARIKVLTRQKDTLTAEIENIKQLRHSLEPLRKEIANLQKSKDILTRDIRRIYNEKYTVKPIKSSNDLWYLASNNRLGLEYDDGHIELIKTSGPTSNKLSPEYERDIRAGICRMIEYIPEPKIQIPQRILDELIDKIDKTKPISQDVANLINQSDEVEEVIQQHHLHL
jgi:archaellum component FlaC